MDRNLNTLQPTALDSDGSYFVLPRRVYESLFDLKESVPQTVPISVVIPVYNEVNTVQTVIERVLATGFDVEVIVIDDASTDGTRELLQSYSHPRVKTIFHSKNAGKGAALRSGFALATNPYVLIQDADLEYDPNDFAAMLAPLVDGRADMVYGSRFLGGPHRVLFFWHYVANRLLTLAANMITDLNLSDMETGRKAFLRERLMQLKLSANRFTFEPEITVKASMAQWRVYEVPVSYSGRTYSEGKKIGWRDAFAAIWAIIYFRLAG
jgi:glycosyltransferase involved in cell wall biosynthesis